MIRLKESGKHFMTRRERQVKEELIKLLKANRHAKYAQRLEMFDLAIVSLADDPHFTAAVSFENATIYISEGFVNGSPGVFKQLDMVIRHELAHRLMQHQIRMLNELGDIKYAHQKFSSLLMHLYNIIEDDEISNTRYTEADKKLARCLVINGEVIKGLVTEDHRPDWAKLTLEEMYLKLSEELEEVHESISYGDDPNPAKDYIKGQLSGLFIYTDTKSPSKIRRPIDVFMQGNTYKEYPEEVQNIITVLYNSLKDQTPETIESFYDSIVKSNPTEPTEITGPIGTIMDDITNEPLLLYTPEERWIAMQVLKNMAGNINFNPLKYKIKRGSHSPEYVKQYNSIIKSLDKKSISDETLQDILQSIGAL